MVSVYDGISYCKYLDIGDWRVSVDNLRIKFAYKLQTYNFDRGAAYPSVDAVCCRLERLAYDVNCSVDTEWAYKDYFKIGAYARTCTVKGLHWSCAVLVGRYCYDAACKQVAPEAVLDVNPNKVPLEVLRQLCLLLRDGAVSVQVVRYDVAYDISLPRAEVRLVQDMARGYRMFRQGGAVTEYQGERGHDNALKVYDKTAEDELDCDVTRVEVTYAAGHKGGHEAGFPLLHRAGPLQLGLELSDLPFAVRACYLHPDLVDVMRESVSANTYRKYMSILDGLQGVVLAPPDWQKVDNFVFAAVRDYVGF